MAVDIVISEFMHEPSVRDLQRDYTVLYDPDLVMRPDKLLARLDGARALIVRNRTQVDNALLEAGHNLHVIGRLGVGLDNIDLDACRAHGVRVMPAAGANNVAVAEYVLAAALLLVRGAYCARERMLAGGWPRNELVGGEIAGRTLGLVGFGAIAREVATRMSALGMHVQAYDPMIPDESPIWLSNGVKPVTFEALFPQSDVVSVHVPLTKDTVHMVGAPQFAAMHSKAIFINTARGGVVDDDSLAHALRTGSIAGAAVDVFEDEPLSADSVFRDVTNLLPTPHIAGVTRESSARVGQVTAENVRRVLEGK